MKYERPRLFDSKYFAMTEAGCMDGSTPAFTPCECEAGGNPASQGAACQGGCTAKNKCTSGVSAGFSGQPQGCENGIGAKQNPRLTGCINGEGVTTNPSPPYGGCFSGYSAMGCSTGNNRFLA